MQQQIQLPTSTAQLGAQLMRHLLFTIDFDVNHPGPAAAFPEFLATFDKEAEVQRLLDLATALDSGVKTLEFA